MNPNHKPNWQEWTPPECIDYWQQCFLDEVNYHNDNVQGFLENGGKLTDLQIAEDFANDYQISALSKIEKLLTVPESKQLWDKMKQLDINPYYFTICVQLALNGKWCMDFTKAESEQACIIESQAIALAQSMKAANYHESYFVGLNEIIKRAQADKRIYQRQTKLVGEKTKSSVIDDVYFCRTLAEFFIKQTQQARHDLTAICASIIFSKEFSYEKVKQTVNRRNKNN